MYCIGKVIKAIKKFPNGSQENTIAAQMPDNELVPIANLKDFKTTLERLADDAKMDLNYAAFNLSETGLFYVPVQNLQKVVDSLNNFTGGIFELQQINHIKNTLPIIKATDFQKDHSFVVF